MKRQYILMGCLIGLLCGLLPGRIYAQPQYEEVIVDFVDTVSEADITHVAQEIGAKLVYNSIFSKHEQLLRFSIRGKTPAEVRQLIDKLNAEKQVIEFAEPDYFYQAYGTPNDPMYPKQWNMKMLNVEQAWEKATGDGAIVAVIDTGVAYEDYKDGKGAYHRVPDLANTKFVPGYDFIDDDEHPNDDNGHGTHVAGTIAQATNNKLGVAGIAYNAKIMPLKVLSKQGYGSVADIAEAIEFAADHGANVINMSLGGPFPSKIMQEAVEYAYKKGVTIICAAGNESRNRASYPALYQYAIGVSSVGPNGELAPYSNYGEGTDIAAPGGNKQLGEESGVLQNTIGRMDPTKDGYEYFQGTSMAAPHVAGVAALIVSLGVKEPQKVEKILFTTATKKADQNKFGAGLVNAAAAVKGVKSGDQTAATGVAPAPQKMTQETAAETGAGQMGATFAQKAASKLKNSMLYFIAGVGFAILYFKLLTRADGWGTIFSFVFSLAMFLASPGLFFVIDGSGAINPVWHSVLIPLVLVIALFGAKQGKWFALGFAVGMASHLFVETFFTLTDVAYIPGFLLDKAWLLLNGLGCFGLALFAGRKS